ncbi:septum formation initiator family protein [Actinotalea sp. M2MS4P-6]|uniref:FtsB family cell division protein n=1 Tax=Actinotalea sp. M2MS4P-6 TaxID=2983762 RepID=UPI0021E38AC3|nr:septum formation initiator family protein [Actinotalea sp. M2MS4P-6]MCV2396366.1 septum formation initiator family protein [Actinotalea sp. M2MS4P-6]
MTRRPTLPHAHGPAGGPAQQRRDSSTRPARSSRAPRREERTGGVDLARLLSVRALLLGVVALIAFAMVFPTVRAYLGQRTELDALAAEVAAAEAREEQLNADLARWQTDAYVIAQARERLSYVMPGETAYRVIDPEVVQEESHVSSSDPDSETGLALPVGGSAAPWYTTVWESVQLAGEAPLPGGGSAGTEASDGELGPAEDPATGTAEDPADEGDG